MIADVELDRAAWALWCDDARRQPRVNPRDFWPRVRVEYRRRAKLALEAFLNLDDTGDRDVATTGPPRAAGGDIPDHVLGTGPPLPAGKLFA